MSDVNPALTLTRQVANQYARLGFPHTLEARVSARGKPMTIQPLTIAEARYVVTVVRRRGWDYFVKKQCFRNAQTALLDDDEGLLHYCEGYYVFDQCPIAIQHAWLLLNDKIIDLTARTISRTTRHHYVGIKIDSYIVRESMLSSKVYGPVLEGPFARHLL